MKTKTARPKSNVAVDAEPTIEPAAVEPSAIAIDRDIAMPTFGRARRSSRYPFDAMQVNDSFAFPPEIKLGSAHSIVSARNRRQPERKFRVKRTDAGMRCWRIA
jgi:hypothetical protein